MIKNSLEDPEPPASKKEVFEMLVKKNMRRAYFSALGLLGSHDAAMDVSQEAFIRAYKSFDGFDENKNFFTWYYKILKNLCLNYIRDRKSKKEHSYLEYKKSELKSENPEEDIAGKEMLEKLQQAIDELNVDERELIILKEFENYSYKEMAVLLNIPIGSVMSGLFYARKKLSTKLREMI